MYVALRRYELLDSRPKEKFSTFLAPINDANFTRKFFAQCDHVYVLEQEILRLERLADSFEEHKVGGEYVVLDERVVAYTDVLEQIEKVRDDLHAARVKFHLLEDEARYRNYKKRQENR